jgi:hypothetical protein
MTSRCHWKKNEFFGGIDHSALTGLAFHLIIKRSIKDRNLSSNRS